MLCLHFELIYFVKYDILTVISHTVLVCYGLINECNTEFQLKDASKDAKPRQYLYLNVPPLF